RSRREWPRIHGPAGDAAYVRKANATGVVPCFGRPVKTSRRTGRSARRGKPVHTLKMRRSPRLWWHSSATSDQKEDQQYRNRNSQEPEKDPPELPGLRCTFAEILHVLESP